MTMTYRVPNIFHTTHLVEDLPAAKAWFERVFARRVVSWADRWDLSAVQADYPVDYSFMVQIGDFVHDALCPSMYQPPNSDSVLWDDVAVGLAGISWWLKDSRAFSQAMANKSIRLRDQSGNLVQGGQFGTNLIVPEMSLMTTAAEDAGFAHSFTELLPPHLARYGAALPRLSRDEWNPATDGTDPLQIERVAYHTLLTSNPERSLRFMTEVLDGKIVHRSPDGTNGTESVFVFFADTMLEFALRDGSKEEFDQYHQITLRTLDLARARGHLIRSGVELLIEDRGCLVSDPPSSLGVRWGFVGDYVPGDPRA